MLNIQMGACYSLPIVKKALPKQATYASVLKEEEDDVELIDEVELIEGEID